MLDNILFGITLVLVFMLIVNILAKRKTTNKFNQRSQKNIDHIEFSPRGPIFITRLNYPGNFIEPTQEKSGYLSFIGFIK